MCSRDGTLSGKHVFRYIYIRVDYQVLANIVCPANFFDFNVAKLSSIFITNYY